MNNQTMYNDLLGVKPRKHSYRELAKRRFNRNILYFIQNINENESIADSLCGNMYADRKELQRVRTAYKISRDLIKQADKYSTVNLSTYAPYKNEIREALKLLSKNQLTLNI